MLAAILLAPSASAAGPRVENEAETTGLFPFVSLRATAAYPKHIYIKASSTTHTITGDFSVNCSRGSEIRYDQGSIFIVGSGKARVPVTIKGAAKCRIRAFVDTQTQGEVASDLYMGIYSVKRTQKRPGHGGPGRR